MNNEQGLSGQNWFDLIRSILFSILDMVDPLQPTAPLRSESLALLHS